jgi:hypothetical protein
MMARRGPVAAAFTLVIGIYLLIIHEILGSIRWSFLLQLLGLGGLNLCVFSIDVRQIVLLEILKICFVLVFT